jgi:hypothetical protein
VNRHILGISWKRYAQPNTEPGKTGVFFNLAKRRNSSNTLTFEQRAKQAQEDDRRKDFAQRCTTVALFLDASLDKVQLQLRTANAAHLARRKP